MSNTFFQGGKNYFRVGFAPLVTGLIKINKFPFRKCCEKNISVTVCENVVPRLNKHDDVIKRRFMKIAPPWNEELVVPLVNTSAVHVSAFRQTMSLCKNAVWRLRTSLWHKIHNRQEEDQPEVGFLKIIITLCDYSRSNSFWLCRPDSGSSV